MKTTSMLLTHSIPGIVDAFTGWLEGHGETSYDHQSFFAGPIGGRAKALYYQRPRLGTLAVAPMIFCEAFLPMARTMFWQEQRFPIADAHYAMGFAMLSRITGDERHYRKAVHFLEVLEQTRCPGYEHFGWGYPFDWVTRTGVMHSQTPLITSTAYIYEAFGSVYAIDGRQHWLDVMQSTAEHAFTDFKDRLISSDSASVGYNPHDTEAGVINASAYRAFLLTSAALQFSRDDYRQAAERNLNYVLGAQQSDGSWFYATDGVRNFVDHFHTCFVLKSLAKIDALIGHPGCRRAIDAGVGYYVRHLFDEQGLPKPFASAPRLTVYKRELYDYAECINLCTLLRGRYGELDARLSTTLADLVENWRKPDGSFRSRRLLLGWDNVPMHRWAQAQLFRSLCFMQLQANSAPATPPAVVAAAGAAHCAATSAEAAH
jgi:hypothetical protein